MEFIVVGGVLFWIITALLILDLVLLTGSESYGWVFTSIVIYILLMHFCSDKDPWTVLFDNIQTYVLYAGYYLALGVVWSLPKWYFFTGKVARTAIALRAKFLKDRDIDEEEARTDPDQIAGWRDTLVRNSRSLYHQSLPPIANQNTDRISGWIILWPFSLIGTLIDDPLRRLVNVIISMFGGMYNKISTHQLGDIPGYD